MSDRQQNKEPVEDADPVLREYIERCGEQRNLEYKRSMSWDKPETKAKLTKATLAMSNLRDGGVIVIGMDEIENGKWIPAGMPPSDFDSYNQDHCVEHFNKYADPFVECTIHKIRHEAKLFVIIEVSEFDELPVVCKKDDSANLERGRIFIRSRSKNETTRVQSQTEMREILTLATEKGVRKFITTIERSGLKVTDIHGHHNEFFEQELNGL